MRLAALAIAFTVLATPALAQFPPTGIYACVGADGALVGELTLLVAGDYSFKGTDGNSASGQVASAGTDVNPLSGPLREMELSGVFGTDDTGRTVFKFMRPSGEAITCQ